MKHLIFKKHVRPVFIETGTAGGEGVAAALKAQFHKVISIELNPEAYERAFKRFGQRKRRVQLYLGDSREILPQVLENVDQPCTFWLDAHYCGEGSAGEQFNSPLMDELRIIGQHAIREHVIMIDDMRLIRDKEIWKGFPYCVCDIEEFIHAINPEYHISYEKGETDNDILVASV